MRASRSNLSKAVVCFYLGMTASHYKKISDLVRLSGGFTAKLQDAKGILVFFRKSQIESIFVECSIGIVHNHKRASTLKPKKIIKRS